MASEEKIPVTENNKRFVGDVVNGLVIVNTLVYIGFIVAHANGFGVEFSPSFAQDGFCVSNKNGPVYMQSHALCFYEDTIFAIIVWFLVNIIGKDMVPENDVALMTRYAFSTFIHGCAHLSLAYRDYAADDPDDVVETWKPNFKPQRVITLLVFWSTFMSVIHSDHSISKKALRSIFWTAVHLYVPRLYAFTFVHCVLVMEFSFKTMMIKEVDRFYNLRIPLLNIPNSIIAWMEAFACEKFLQPYGGHAIYDAFIPITMIAYIFVLFYSSKKTKKID